MIGYAICDLDDIHKNLEHSVRNLKTKIIEIQKESNQWSEEEIITLARKYSFISVHAPTNNVDLSSLNEEVRKRSIQKTIKSMDLANKINADVLVIHPIHYEEFIQPEDRMWKREQFMDSYEHHLVPHYVDNGHKYALGIENVEYSKYPATLEELAELHASTSAIHKTGMVIDIAHIWNSRRILAENEYLKDVILGYPRMPEILFEYVREFIKNNKDKILMYHVGNFGINPVRTHDPLNKEINVELRKILPLTKDKPVILEIYRQDYESLKDSKKIAEEIINGKHNVL